MVEHPVESYVERSRRSRRVELAKLAQDRHADASVVVGLSWRLNGHQAHIDYTGGLDTVKIRRSLAAWGSLKLGKPLPHIWPDLADNDIKKPEASEKAGASLDSRKSRPEAPSARDALARAAPVDFQRRSIQRLPGETVEAQHARILTENERKSYDFAAVLARVDTGAMASLARDLLEERHHHQSPAHAPEPLPLPQISNPFFGAGHVFYVIQFWSDGRREAIKWIMKIPAASEDGTWDELRRETLRTEAFLLHKLRTETTIPVPEVIDADCQADNVIHVPWLLMEFVQGRRLEDVWFGHDIGGGVHAHVLRERREKILENVADAMLQLGRYEFDCGGAPYFDQEHGDLVGTRRLRELDIQAMVNRWFMDEECESTPLYRRAGPWDDTTAMYTAMLDAYPPATVTERGVDELLRLLVGQVREPVTSRARKSLSLPPPSPGSSRRINSRMEEGKFVLTHPDLSMRNILLAEDGTTIKTILGWDGARAAPRSLGNEALPRWLVRDFNPFAWRWQPAADFWRKNHVPPECNRFEDPPWVLRELRDYYANAVRELKKKRGKRRTPPRGVKAGAPGEEQADVGGNYEEVDVTKQSLLTLTLDAAIRDPRCRTAALRRVMEKCSRSFEELDFDLFVETLGEGYEVDTFKLKCLAKNIRELVDKGFVKGAVVW
ncbi:hypothetical protein HD806DRAFT_216730 [Xylariaceae sp. AK1471]|nr:hypothetical protein HD806DRAFT_216730 [Xylariaceae sp. AK1471]